MKWGWWNSLQEKFSNSTHATISFLKGLALLSGHYSRQKHTDRFAKQREQTGNGNSKINHTLRNKIKNKQKISPNKQNSQNKQNHQKQTQNTGQHKQVPPQLLTVSSHEASTSCMQETQSHQWPLPLHRTNITSGGQTCPSQAPFPHVKLQIPRSLTLQASAQPLCA